MPVQALYAGLTREARGLSYCWAADGTILLSLDCCPSNVSPITYQSLLADLKSLCSWQLDHNVVVALPEELVEVLTVYHDLDRVSHGENTLLLVSTPPDEYFDAIAA